jgi:hypothetical protein
MEKRSFVDIRSLTLFSFHELWSGISVAAPHHLDWIRTCAIKGFSLALIERTELGSLILGVLTEAEE